MVECLDEKRDNDRAPANNGTNDETEVRALLLDAKASNVIQETDGLRLQASRIMLWTGTNRDINFRVDLVSKAFITI
jgi:hypothetical protein